MAGTKAGGQKAAATNRKRYGAGFYSKIGAKGGASGNSGGFASDVRDANGLTGRQRASRFGAVGGRISRRSKRGE